MDIVSLEPYLSQLLVSFDEESSVVACTKACPESLDMAQRVADWTPADGVTVEWSRLRALEPNLVLCSAADESLAKKLQEFFPETTVENLFPKTLSQVYESIERLGVLLGKKDRGITLAQRIRAQLMNWADNFYDRTRGKRVSVLVESSPLTAAGWWVPDVVRLCSAQPQGKSGEAPQRTDWKQIQAFAPDVMLVAPTTCSGDPLALFQEYEKLPEWDRLLAVKRGQVFFMSEPALFSYPSMHLIEAAGILVSAIAGFESGYITTKDSFQRLRWLEMQRHRFVRESKK